MAPPRNWNEWQALTQRRTRNDHLVAPGLARNPVVLHDVRPLLVHDFPTLFGESVHSFTVNWNLNMAARYGVEEQLR